MKLVSRKEWGARAPKAAASSLGSTRGVKVHYTGATETARTHVQCAARVRGVQDGHMDGNGWNDVGYSFLVCQHGYVFVGRGLHHLPAANGPDLNSGHYAVCGLVGNKGVTEPTPAMLDGIRDAIEYCRNSGDAGAEIKGHRDGYSTDCPGGPLYAWVRKGAPRPNQQEDDMTPDEVFKAVWQKDAIPSPGPDPKNPTWAASSHLTDINGKVRQLLAKVDAQDEALASVQAELTNTRGVLTQLVTLLTPPETPST